MLAEREVQREFISIFPIFALLHVVAGIAVLLT
jgi:hypothetical protein